MLFRAFLVGLFLLVFLPRLALACTSPAGTIGSIAYDSNTDTFVGCTPLGWTALHGKPGPTDGLVRHYTFNETSGTTAADSSSNATTATITGGSTWAPSGGRIGGALSSTGTFNSGSLTGLQTTGITLTGWMKTAANYSSNDIIKHAAWPSGAGSWVLYTNAAGDIIFGVSEAGIHQRSTITPAAVVLDTWQHFAGTYDGTTLRLYIDGVLMNSNASYPNLPLATTGSARITKSAPSFDDLRIYNRALSAAEIAQLASMSNACTSPAGDWGNLLYDGNSGTFVGCTPAGWTAFHGVVPGTGGCTAPAGNPGDIMYDGNTDRFVGCTPGGWVAFNPAPTDPCHGSPTPGTTCLDGSIYAGNSPDAGAKMFTTPADAGQFPWNNDNGGVSFVDTSLTNCTTSTSVQSTCQTGQSNTVSLINEDSDSLASGVQPHLAAQYCADLVAHGRSDWYLPAQDEVKLLYTNRNSGALSGTFNISGTYPASFYWSSSEQNLTNARDIRFDTGVGSSNLKRNLESVRCVRRLN